jgi:hypothetical protein
MTTEQLKELGEALSILSAKSSVLQERDELRSLMEENLLAEEVIFCSLFDDSRYLTRLAPPRIPNLPPVHLRNAFVPCLPKSTHSYRNMTLGSEVRYR